MARLRLRRQGGAPENAPLLVVRTEGQRRVVAACCAAGAAGGVHAGMPVSEARAVLPPGVILVPHTPERDAAALEQLAARAQRFSPVVAVDGPDGLLLDVGGCERLFKGEARLLRLALRFFMGLGLAARAAIAPTFACASAVARGSEWRSGGVAERKSEAGSIVRAGEERAALGPLPLAALRPPSGVVESLREVGVERIGEALALPRASLAPRLGPELARLLDAALGLAPEVIEPVRPRPPCRAERRFDGPTTSLEGVQLVARDLLLELSAALGAVERGALRIDVDLTRSAAAPLRLVVSLSRPTRDATRLRSLLAPMLERANLGEGVEAIAVTASRTARTRHWQERRWGEEEGRGEGAEEAAGELVDTLSNRLGHARVARAGLVESHAPRRAFAMRPALAAPSTPRGAQRTPGDRPMRLFDQPVPAEVTLLTPDGPLLRVRSGGSEGLVTACLGPERIGPEWWRGERGAHDFFKVQRDDGRWLWLRRDLRSGRWFVEGVWS